MLVCDVDAAVRIEVESASVPSDAWCSREGSALCGGVSEREREQTVAESEGVELQYFHCYKCSPWLSLPMNDESMITGPMQREVVCEGVLQAAYIYSFTCLLGFPSCVE